MHFRLFYRGPLKANGSPRDKHDLRRQFHPQLKALWSQAPLQEVPRFINIDPTKGKSIGVVREQYTFVPLVCQALELVAQLDILILRPEPPGMVVTQGGDIDNRVKTLLDSLQVPKVEQLSGIGAPGEGENPFYCLVEDDNLFTGLQITTDRLLETPSRPNEVVLVIEVTAEFTHQHFTNLITPPQLQ